MNAQSSQVINNLQTVLSQAHLAKGNEEILPNFHLRGDLDSELLRKEGRYNPVGVTDSLWGFKWLQGRKSKWQQPHPQRLSLLREFPANSLKGRAPQVIHNQNALPMLLATFSGTSENAPITVTTNQIPLHQVLILRASHQRMAFALPEY